MSRVAGGARFCDKGAQQQEAQHMSIGPWQVIIVLVIILILFGAGKLPRVMGDLAKGVKNFKKGLNEEDRETAIESKPAETVAAESEKDTAART